MNLKPAKPDHLPITIQRQSLNFRQLLLLVLVSILLHLLGLFLYARSQVKQKVNSQKTPLNPIEFTVIPEAPKVVETQQKTQVAPPASEPAPEPKSTAPATPPPQPQPTVKSEPPISTDSSQGSTRIPAKPNASPPQSTATLPQPTTKAPSLPPKQPKSELGTSAKDLLGGNYQKTLASGGDAFFSPEALEYKSVLNPEQIKALKGIDLRKYLAQMEGKVKPNWNPSFRQDERTTVLTFNIEKNGQVTGLKIAQSSGAEDADREALAAVQNSVPFAPLPNNFPLQSLEITFSFNIHIY